MKTYNNYIVKTLIVAIAAYLPLQLAYSFGCYASDHYGSSGGQDTSGYSCNTNGYVDPENFTACQTISYEDGEDVKFPMFDTIDVDLGEFSVSGKFHLYEYIGPPDAANDDASCVYFRMIAEDVEAVAADVDVYPGYSVVPPPETLDTGWCFYGGTSMTCTVAESPSFHWPSIQTLVFDTWLGIDEMQGMEPDENSLAVGFSISAEGGATTSLSWNVKGEADIDVYPSCTYTVDYDTKMVFPAGNFGAIAAANVRAQVNQALCTPPPE